MIDRCRALEEGTGTLLQVEGAETADISVTNSDLRLAREALRLVDVTGEELVYQAANRV